MLANLALAAVLTLGVNPHVCCSPAPAHELDSALRELFEGGRNFEEFLGAARRRTELWHRLQQEGRVSEELVARARAVAGTWRILAVAEDWCGDSAYNLPYVAKLADAVVGLELRIVDSQVGRELMESHRAPDGRPATPTFLLLDASWNEAGCFVERPSPLMAWTMDNRAEKSSDEVHAYVLDWYERDRGHGTVTDLVELMESAAAGHPRCAGGAS
ncbi:MAG: thioredoxin family protein [Longimicrobiales bacterium]|nr:thioredoxin family protein [Longimicrobiales bacterium]